jgi:hypothetical protein
MNTKATESFSERVPRLADTWALRWLRRATSFEAAWMCLAMAGWA